MSHSPVFLSRVMAFALALFLANPGNGAEVVSDPSVSTYGVLNPAAPAELGLFAFLVGKWSGTATARNPDGSYSEFQFDWIGRYVLDGMAIADEMRMPDGTVQGMSLRFYDSARKQWAVEFLNFGRSFLRRQVGGEWGGVTQEGSRITINQPAPNGSGREVYTRVDADHFTYSMDFAQDDGRTWDEGVVMIDMERKEGP